MKCKYPVVLEVGQAFPCGQCLPCRINRRRVWMHRILLEAAQHGENCFATLTYDDDSIPESGSLVPRDLQLWLKKFRRAISPERVRYFAVGEYGDETFRPHYHVAIFGFGSCLYGISRYSTFRKNCCVRCDLVRDTWGMGNISLGQLERGSASYVAKYTVKKMTAKTDDRLNGRYPEFARMSLRPGIGGDFMHDVAHSLMEYALDDTLVDVPGALRHGSRLLPLGRYLRRRLRSMIGKDEKVPDAILSQLKEELRPMLESALSVTIPHGAGSYELRKALFADEVYKSQKGAIASLEGREKLYKRRGAI